MGSRILPRRERSAYICVDGSRWSRFTGGLAASPFSEMGFSMNYSWPVASRVGKRPLPVIAIGLLVVVLGLGGMPGTHSTNEQPLITGPVAWLLTASTDLGPARSSQISVTATLHRSARPQILFGWAADRHLTVRWDPGADWAYIEGERGVDEVTVSRAATSTRGCRRRCRAGSRSGCRAAPSSLHPAGRRRR